MVASFLNKGADAAKQAEKAETQAEERKAGFLQRFYLKPGNERTVTFLDGGLSEDGMLYGVNFWEHQLNLNGHWRNWFPCTQNKEPCPICDGGDNPSLVYLFTVIDHTGYKTKEGKEVKNERVLFACKNETFKRLQSLAVKRGGLTGLRIDISRTTEKSANVGDLFDVVGQSTQQDIMGATGLTAEDVVPFDYDEVIVYRDAETLKGMGFGGNAAVAGGVPPQDAPAVDYQNEL